MTQNRKIMGMTPVQIGILAGLGAVVLILFGCIAWFLMGGSFQLPSLARAPEKTPTPQMTSTMIVLPTLTPTPTLTPVPYEQLIPPGWKQHTTGLIEIWLPDGYKKINPQDVLVGPSSGTSITELVLQNSLSDSSLYNNLVAISYEPLTVDTLDNFLDQEIKNISPEIIITGRRKISLNGNEAVAITAAGRINGIDVNELVYVFLDGSTIWYIEYVAQINEYYNLLPIYEQSAKTFRIVR